ncbi:MAG: Ig-like domain-containing protein [Chitinophagales bacterium]
MKLPHFFLAVFLLSLTTFAVAQQKDKKILEPNAVNDTLVIKRTSPELFNLLVNDYESYDYKINKLTIVEEPQGIIRVERHKGVDLVLYHANYLGDEPDQFTYEICDESGKCDRATVHIVKCPPSQADFPRVEKIFIQEGDVLPFGYPDKKIRISKAPIHGRVEMSGDSSTAIYHPKIGYTGEEKFNFTVYEDQGLCGLRYHEGVNNKVYILPSNEKNQPPVAVTDEVETFGSIIRIEALKNDYDPENTLDNRICSISRAKNGKLRRTTKVITYIPNNGFKGTEEITYEICDYNKVCVEGKIIIHVKDRNAPVEYEGYEEEVEETNEEDGKKSKKDKKKKKKKKKK